MLKNKHKIFFLSLMVLLIVGLTAVSATDNITSSATTVSADMPNTSLSIEKTNIKEDTNNIKSSDNIKTSQQTTKNLENKKDTSKDKTPVKTIKQDTQNTTSNVNNYDELKNTINSAKDKEVTISIGKDITTTDDTLNISGNNTKVTINGNGNKIRSDDENHFITVNKGTTLTIKNLIVYGCGLDGNGGAISNYGTLEVINCTFEENNGYMMGGAIYNENNLTVINSTFIKNFASFFGGAIYNSAKLTVFNSIFIQNNADDGGAIHITAPKSRNAQTYIDNSIFTENSAGNGGAIYAEDGVAYINNSRLLNNGGNNAIYSSSSCKANYLTVENTYISGTQKNLLDAEELEEDAMYPHEINLINNTFTSKVDTHIIIDVLKNSYKHVTINITGLNRFNTQIGNETVKIYENEKLLSTIDLVDGSATTNLNLPTGKHDITVVYDGNENLYMPSTNTTTIDAAKEPTGMDIYTLNSITTNTTVKVGVHDSKRKTITNGLIEVYDVEDNLVSKGSLVNGTYMINLKPEAGIQKYTIKYLGDNKYNASTIIKSLNIRKEKISMDLYTLKASTVNTTLKILIKDSSKNPLKTGVMVVNDTTTGVVVNTGNIVNGEYIINLTPTAGAHRYRILYVGDDTYKEVAILKTINVLKEKVGMDLYTLKAVTTNTTLKILIKDSSKNPLKSGVMVVNDTTTGVVVSTGNIVNGEYIINMTPTAGAHRYRILYVGDDIYRQVAILKTINVVKDNSAMDIYTLNTTTTNTQFKIVTRNFNKQSINNGTIEVYDTKGSIVSRANVVNGMCIVNLTPTAGAHKYTFKFTNNTMYKDSQVVKSVTISKTKTSIKLSTTSKTTTNTTLVIDVWDTKNMPVKIGSVNVVYMGSVIASANLVNGQAKTTLKLPQGSQKLTVNYLSNDIYAPSTVNGTITIKP